MPEYISKIKNSEPELMPVFILAADMGIRMKRYGPKCLLNIGGDIILDRIIMNTHISFPNNDISIVGGFEFEKIRQYTNNTYKLIENQLYNDTNSAEQVRLALNSSLVDRALFIFGDTIFDKNILYTNNKHSYVMYQHNKTDQPGLNIINNTVHNMCYGLSNEFVGIFYITGKELKLMQHLLNIPKNKKYLIHEIINQCIEAGGKFKAIETKNITMIKTSASLK